MNLPLFQVLVLAALAIRPVVWICHCRCRNQCGRQDDAQENSLEEWAGFTQFVFVRSNSAFALVLNARHDQPVFLVMG
ncbi:hypothetical protein FIV00_10320 [Labrenzia sp. THAF82]|nr:hypothetical protein FIV00_10320 [Labrenzia sp. THAF82]